MGKLLEPSNAFVGGDSRKELSFPHYQNIAVFFVVRKSDLSIVYQCQSSSLKEANAFIGNRDDLEVRYMVVPFVPIPKSRW